jgi:succinate dehydrogenase/fumarate reductase flavoprotein subunit
MSNDSYDLVIAGSGAAGLCAALIAHSKGLRPIILEKTDLIGGTTAYSGGVIWVPNSRQNVETGVPDTTAAAGLYLSSVITTDHESDGRTTYLERGPEAIAYLESVAGPLFYVRPINSPDYYPDADGASQKGRAMTPLNCDGRSLGAHFADIRPPLPEMSLFGRQMLELMDVYHLLNARRSWRSAVHAARLMLRDVSERVFYRKYGRGTRLTNGNALVANLYKAVLKRQIPVLRETPVVDLIMVDGRVQGVVAGNGAGRREIRASHGVILSTGGFPWSKDLREQADDASPVGFSATSPDSKGDGISLAVAKGAQFDRRNSEMAFWSPVSVMTRKDGTTARFPHLMADRAKPGLIAVNKYGRRFYNEAENYHDFTRAMMGRFANEDQQPVHLLCDAAFLRQYMFGAVPPLGAERRRAVKSGYLIEAPTIAELAGRIGVPAANLEDTIAHYNQDATVGLDVDFNKGSNAYNRYLGDATHQPNACVAPIRKEPFYAIRVHAGDIGTTFGLAADIHSRVLDSSGRPIEGLYACGNDRNSVMAGSYPAGGITIGPALAFAYLAVLHAAQSPSGKERP